MTLRERLVESLHLVQQHAHGPAVADDVVHVCQEQILFSVQTNQGRAQQRSRRKIKWTQSVVLSETFSFPRTPFFTQRAQIDQRQLEREGASTRCTGWPPATKKVVRSVW